jgi:hypothetical protein
VTTTRNTTGSGTKSGADVKAGGSMKIEAAPTKNQLPKTATALKQ